MMLFMLRGLSVKGPNHGGGVGGERAPISTGGVADRRVCLSTLQMCPNVCLGCIYVAGRSCSSGKSEDRAQSQHIPAHAGANLPAAGSCQKSLNCVLLVPGVQDTPMAMSPHWQKHFLLKLTFDAFLFPCCISIQEGEVLRAVLGVSRMTSSYQVTIRKCLAQGLTVRKMRSSSFVEREWRQRRPATPPENPALCMSPNGERKSIRMHSSFVVISCRYSLREENARPHADWPRPAGVVGL